MAKVAIVKIGYQRFILPTAMVPYLAEARQIDADYSHTLHEYVKFFPDETTDIEIVFVDELSIVQSKAIYLAEEKARQADKDDNIS